jgi:hypothetical protein
MTKLGFRLKQLSSIPLGPALHMPKNTNSCFGTPKLMLLVLGKLRGF